MLRTGWMLTLHPRNESDQNLVFRDVESPAHKRTIWMVQHETFDWRVAVDGQDVVPFRLGVLMKDGLWKSWKAEVRFPLSHNPDCCYEVVFV